MEREERNYWCLVLLLLGVGNTKLRLYFKQQWDALGVFRSWTDSPHNGADLLRKFKPLPYEKAKVQSGDTSTWDLSLLVKALLNSVPPFVSDKDLVKALKCLKEMRNDLCHAHAATLGTAEFKNKWQDACNALTLFGATTDDFDHVTLDARKPWEDLNLLIQQCASFEDVLKRVTSRQQELQKGQETIAQAQKDHHSLVTSELQLGKETIAQVQKDQKDQHLQVIGGLQELQLRQDTIAQSHKDQKNQHLKGGITHITIHAKDNAQVAVGDKASWTSQRASLPSPLCEQLDVTELASTNLKSSVINGTDFLQVGSQGFVNARTDDIFTNLVIRKYSHPNLESAYRMRQLEVHCEMSSTSVDHIEEVFIGKEKNPKCIQITGKPGIGKTFFCEKIVRDWAKNQLFSSPARSAIPGFQFAYLLKFRDLNSLDKEFNLRELLNLSSLLDGKSMVDDSLMKYFIENPDKLLVILDGYDEYKYRQNIADKYEKQYPNTPLERMPAQALLSKLINKRILKNSVIIVTSRPGEAGKLRKCQFDEYVEINGFSSQQVTEFVEKYFTANEQMKTKVVEFVKTNVNITNFCHIPMMSFLMCGYLKWYLENSRHKLPASTTDLFSEMITTFMKEPQEDLIDTSGETASKSNPSSGFSLKNLFGLKSQSEKTEIPLNPIEKVLLKIAELAAKLLEDKKLVFEEKDIEDNLSPQEIEILKVSGLLNCSGNVEKGPFTLQQSFEFIHPIVQEFLSAQWFVAKNKIPEKQTSGMVFQFMSGLLARKLNDKMMTQIFETVKPEKEDDYDNEQQLLSLRCLCEYGDEKLSDKLLYDNHCRYCTSDGLIGFTRVTDMDCTAISWLLDSLSRLQVDSSRSKLRRVQVLYIDNSLLTLFGVQYLCDSVSRLSTVTKLWLCFCDLNNKCAECIGDIITNTNITDLDLFGNNITNKGAVYLCSNVVRDSCTVTELNLSSNKLITDECREALRDYVRTNKPGVKLVI